MKKTNGNRKTVEEGLMSDEEVRAVAGRMLNAEEQARERAGKPELQDIARKYLNPSSYETDE